MPENKYTFKQEGSNVAVFEGDKRISTATPQAAKAQYGYEAPEADAPISAFEQTQNLNVPGIDSITSPVPAPVNTQSPTLPEPQAPAIQRAYMTSVAENAAQTRTSVENAYKTERERIDAKIKESQSKVDDLTEKQEVMIESDIEPLLTPFREELETSERERLHINENFEANQKLVNELDTLLTEGNELIRGERSRFASRASIAAGTARAMEDVSARAGVIQAVISARNGQISQAYNMIDRSVAAITADRNDRLTYYKTIFDFYESQKGSEEGKILNLEKEDRAFLAAEINLLESDMKKAEEYAENIKEAMIDPDTALLYAQAGVKLTDSPEEVAEKVADAAYAKEVRDISNEMQLAGYTYLATGATPPAGTETKTVTDSKGNKKIYYKTASSSDLPGATALTPENKRQLAGAGFSTVEIGEIERSVNDFGIRATLKAIPNAAQREAVADQYDALDILGEVDTEIEESLSSNDDSTSWWQKIANLFTGQ